MPDNGVVEIRRGSAPSYLCKITTKQIIVRLHTFLPLLFFLGVLGLATHKSSTDPVPPEEEAADLGKLGFSPERALVIVQLSHYLDIVLRHFSTMIPYVYLALRLIVLSFKRLSQTNAIGQPPGECTASMGWTCVMWTMWTSITVFRLVVYIPISRASCGTPAYAHNQCGYYFSNHLWLVSSLIAQLQTELSVLAMGMGEEKSLSWKCRIRFPMLIGWVLLIFLYVESFVTARYWHTEQAVWTAALTGICYQLPVCWWLRLLEKSAEKKDSPGMRLNLSAEDLEGYRGMH